MSSATAAVPPTTSRVHIQPWMLRGIATGAAASGAASRAPVTAPDAA